MSQSRIWTGLAVALSLLAGADRALAHTTLLTPNGGEILECGTTATIQWKVEIQHNTIDWDLEYSVSGSGGPWLPVALDIVKSNNTAGTIHTYTWTVPNTPSSQVRVRVTQDNNGTDYTDISDSNLTIQNTVATDLGYGKVGGNGFVPHIDACGDLGTGGMGGTFTLTDAPANRPVLLVVALSATPTPFYGDTLVPVPIAGVFTLSTNTLGELVLPLPSGLGPLDAYVQAAIDDPGASLGVGLSNALKLSWP